MLVNTECKQVLILGHPWLVFVYDDKDYAQHIKEDGDGDSSGFTLPYVQEIHLPRSSLNKHAVRHEVTHAFLLYMCVTEFVLPQDAQEEFICDFVSYHGEAIIQTANEILKEFA